MKKFFKALTGAVLGCVVATSAGCGLIFDPNRPQIQLPTLSGFKTTFNDGTYQLDNTFETYSKHILTEIYANFAIPSTEDNKSKLEKKPLSTEPQNYDKIRVQVDNTDVVVDIPWKWTFSTSCVGGASEYTFENIVEYYSSTDVQEAYFEEWTKLYAIPLEIVAIQIAMGQTPQVFTVDITNQTTTIYTDNTKNKKVDESYLTEVKDQFKSQGKYVGFTEENIETFKNYFLTEIVGNNIIGTQYDKVVLDIGNITYGALFDKILEIKVDGLNKDFYTPYPASFVLDVMDNTFFGGKEHYVLDHVTAKEYQTTTIMTSKDTKLYGLYLAFEAEQDLNIDVQVNFYNYLGQEIVNYFNETISVKAGKFEIKNWKFINLNKPLAVSKFINTGVEASTQTQISNANQNAKYFTYTPTGTYLEGAMLECDCFTISFNPQKTQNEYCPFKWVIDLEMEAK